ncbi:MAG: RND transporter [Planctomycetia bacterium]|nr:RND transporter [Planctomycetia bacterium]
MMNVDLLKRSAMFGVWLAVAVTTIGCGQPSGDTGSTQISEVSQEPSDGHDHGGWWCNEHGLPEEVCSMCSTQAAAKFKEKGDWCDEHHRAESQCFQCDPSRAEKFVKLYEAKFGEKPPEPQE